MVLKPVDDKFRTSFSGYRITYLDWGWHTTRGFVDYTHAYGQAERYGLRRLPTGISNLAVQLNMSVRLYWQQVTFVGIDAAKKDGYAN